MRESRAMKRYLPLLVLVVVLSVYEWQADRGTNRDRSASGDAAGAATGRVAVESLALGGPRAPITIVTDRFGIPHVHAKTRADLYYAWGFVSARDRLWQLENLRARVEGRRWRWLGNAALTEDGGAQLFELSERSERIWERE